MEKKELSQAEKIKYEEMLAMAEKDPEKVFSELKHQYNKDELSSFLGCFLNNSNDTVFLRRVLEEINSLKNEKNIDDLIDFLMVKEFDEKANQSEVVNLKAICIKAISAFRDKRAIPALLYCLNNKSANYKMRLQAAEALGKIGDKNAVESLINVVSDEEEKSVYVRESAATALGMIGDMRAIDPFLTILEAKKNFLDKFTFLKERVIEALGKMNFTNSKRMMAAFKNALEDDSPQVRINAIECLMNTEEDEAYELIKNKLEDKDEEVVKNAVIALYNIKGKEALFEILKDETMPPVARKEADELYAEYEEEDE